MRQTGEVWLLEPFFFVPSHALPVRPCFLFNADDTTCFLDQKRQKNRTLVTDNSKARNRALNLSFSLSINRKNKGNKRNSKHYAHRQRTIKLNCVTSAIGKLVCVVVQITDYDISSVAVKRCGDSIFYLVLRPGKKGNDQQSKTQAENSKANVQLATRILRDCTLTCLVEEMTRQINASKHAYEISSQGSGKFTESPLSEDMTVEVGDRAVLCFDGDYPYIEAILSNENKTSDGRTLRQCFAAHNIELVKFSGGCSMTQQPNDRSRCFFCLKAAIKRFVFKGHTLLCETFLL
jgi:hypothetical protein